MIKKTSQLFISIVAPLLLFGCASSFHEIKPSTITYQSNPASNNVQIDYQTNLLNGKYAENEKKTGTMLVAIKISNNSGHAFVINDDMKIYAGEKELTPISLNNFYELTRQNANKSLWFLALTPANAYTSQQTTNGSTVTSQSIRFYPVGLILGPALAFGNQAAANGANRRFRKQLDEYDLTGKTVNTGETAYGFIALNASPLQPLVLKTIR